MEVRSENELIDQIISHIRQKAESRRLIAPDIKAETDLLGTGVLDSVGFIELLMMIETDYGYKIDLVDADPERFTTVKGLCELALKSNRDQVLA